MDYSLLRFNCRLQRRLAHLFHIQIRIDSGASLIPRIDGQDGLLLVKPLLKFVIGVVVQLEPVRNDTLREKWLKYQQCSLFVSFCLPLYLSFSLFLSHTHFCTTRDYVNNFFGYSLRSRGHYWTISNYLFSAWYDFMSSLLGLNRTPSFPLHLGKNNNKQLDFTS